MQVIRANRWHHVDLGGPLRPSAPRRCSVCGAEQLTPKGETVVDGVSGRYYAIVRCDGCGYDLLDPRADSHTPASACA